MVGWLTGLMGIPLMFFNQSLVMAIIYVWSQYFKDAIVRFMFGLRFKVKIKFFVLVI